MITRRLGKNVPRGVGRLLDVAALHVVTHGKIIRTCPISHNEERRCSQAVERLIDQRVVVDMTRSQSWFISSASVLNDV